MRIAFAALAALLVSAATALAEEPAAAPAGCYATDSQYQRLFDEAMALIRAGEQPALARALLQLADRQCRSIAAVEAEALLLYDQRRYAEAHALLTRVLEVPDQAASANAAALHRSLLEKFDEDGFATVVLRFEPTDAEVVLDGLPVTFRPGQLIWRVERGSHTLVLRRDGYLPAAIEVQLEPGQTWTGKLGLVSRDEALSQ
jgi:hypothetical protein